MKISFLFLLSFMFLSGGDFKSAQVKYPRVKKCYQEKEETFSRVYQAKFIDYEKQTILIRIFKYENKLELWVKNSNASYSLLKTYNICSASGDIGQKRKADDYQVIEGFYHIEDRFNLQNSFYVSLGLNYPNASDKILGVKKNSRGNIFIHGSCISIGCIAMTDDKIKEIYIAAVKAKNGGQNNIPVQVLPFRMTISNMSNANNQYEKNKQLLLFWENVKIRYDYFEKNKHLPSVSDDSKGKYIVK